ncbi:hypothetical protein CFC21_052517 [Triticum aestivum]|uniref:Uncharacterized protein n=3 Tax=Triticum TaxID=4564 RepID=A0A9R0SCP4_TRITD|nr:hypothetical protein CFC21_052517 [Triticum aestivum]VAH92192.1 unnamed protein product [Triticum turgidum subsp. durum]
MAGADEGPVEYSLSVRWWSGSPVFHGNADSSCREKGGLVCGRLWLVGEGSGHLLRGELASSPDLKQERLGEHPQQGDRLRPIYFWDLDPVSFELVAVAVRQRQFGKGLLLLQACGRTDVFSGAGCSSTAEKWAPLRQIYYGKKNCTHVDSFFLDNQASDKDILSRDIPTP